MKLSKKLAHYYDDGAAPKFYITGDKHRNYNIVKMFCREMKTKKTDHRILVHMG